MSDPIALHWRRAPGADAQHLDTEAELVLPTIGYILASVTEDADPNDPGMVWRWCIEDSWLLDEANELAAGYTPTQKDARIAVMDWVRATTKEQTA